MKKVILIIIDALTSRVVIPAMKEGRLPNIQALAEAGSLNSECISIFPSITHAATASIATGRYPRDHGIAGTHWYAHQDEQMVYYGSDLWVILGEGLNQFLENFAIKLNHEWLQAETVYQTVERAGLRAACINHLIFRGDVEHKIDTPQLLEMLSIAPSKKTVYGPSLLGMGDFIPMFSQVTAETEALEVSGGMLHRFGFDDNHTADVLIQLAKMDKLPDFTLAYFPDNDYSSHKEGPAAALPIIEAIDERLGDFFEACGGLSRLLEDYSIVLTGDHAQSETKVETTTAGIALDELLEDFTIAPIGQSWREQDQLIACPNLRMAQIYFKKPTSQQVDAIVKQLLTEPRVDQVIWRGGLKDDEVSGDYFVSTGDRGGLHFWPGMEGPNTAKDVYGCVWSWRGNLEAVDGWLSADGIITFSDYPNAFERIAGGLECPTSGQIWVTARPGYEFTRWEMSLHNDGGSHASLHAGDSIVPLILAGAPEGITLPAYPRTVDLVPLCLTILDLEPSYAIGASHIQQK